LRAATNSAIIASASAILSVVAGTFCSIVVAVPLRRLVAHTTGLIVGLRFVPPVVLVPFYYLILTSTGLIDTLNGLILVHAIAGTALAAICLVPSFLSIRDADIQQARLEGASFLPHILFSVIMPRIRSALAIGWCFAFMASWNELLLMSFLTETPRSQGISVYCLAAIGQFRIDFKGLCLGGALSLVPCIVGMIAFSWLLRRLSSLGLREDIGP
jgi:ABC-type glycerol-3-phosphate transport system permease component